MILPIIPQKILNKAVLASLNTLCTSRQRPGPDMYPLARGGVNYRPPPFATFRIADLNPKTICVRCGEIHGAAHAWTTVSPGLAVWVVSGSPTDEAGEYSMDNGFAVRVGAGLKTSITDIGLAIKIELLGKKIASFMGGVRDGEWECYIGEARTGDVD